MHGRYDISERYAWRSLGFERTALHVNHQRVERLYRLEGMAVRRRRRKCVAVPRVPRPVVTQPNDTWGIDFVSDPLASGWRVRCFTVGDQCRRESPGMTVAHSLPSVAVIRALADARFHLERWRRSYNTDRPHESHFPLAPAEFVETVSSSTARLSAWQSSTGGGTLSPHAPPLPS